MGFIFRIYLSRQITTVELGVYSVAVSVCSIFITILTAGIPLTISRKTAEFSVDNNKNETYKYVSSGITIACVLSIFVVLFILSFRGLFARIFADFNSYFVMLTLIPYMVFSAIYAPIRGYLWGKEQYAHASFVEFIEQLLKIIVCVILFNIGIKNINLPAGLSMSVACGLSMVLGFYFFKKDGGQLASPKGTIVPMAKIVAPLNALRVAGSLLQPLISIFLPLMLVKAGYSSNQALSQLGMILGMTFPIITIPTTLVGSLAMALVPKLSVLQKENQQFKLQSKIYNSLSFTFFCCFIFLPMFLALGCPICEVLFNNTQAGIYLKYSAWLTLPMGISQITTAILNSLGHERFVFVSYSISAIFIVLSIFLLPQFVGIYAILIGMGLQSVVVCILNIIKIKKLTEYKSQLSLLTKYMIVTALLYLLCAWIYPFIASFLGKFVALIVIGIISCSSFVLLAYSFNLINLNVLLCRYKKHNK